MYDNAMKSKLKHFPRKEKHIETIWVGPHKSFSYRLSRHRLVFDVLHGSPESTRTHPTYKSSGTFSLPNQRRSQKMKIAPPLPNTILYPIIRCDRPQSPCSQTGKKTCQKIMKYKNLTFTPFFYCQHSQCYRYARTDKNYSQRYSQCDRRCLNRYLPEIILTTALQTQTLTKHNPTATPTPSTILLRRTHIFCPM